MLTMGHEKEGGGDKVLVDWKKTYVVTDVSIRWKRRTADTKDQGGTRERPIHSALEYENQ